MPNVASSISHDVVAPAQVLRDVFGYTQFRDGQQEVISHTLEGGDSLVLLPTGGGKSLCYQIPAIAMQGTAIVVSPLISLMQDQVEQLAAMGVNATFINSALSREQIQQRWQAIAHDKVDLVYVSPERLMTVDCLERLRFLNINLFAIDEAHCVSHWGHDFRADYRQLGVLKQQFPHIPVMALTATADLATRADILQQLGLQQPYIYKGSFDRPNIRYSLLPKYKAFDQVVNFVNQQEGSGIIYCSSRAKVDDLTTRLRNQGINCAAYHAGKDVTERESVQRAFLSDDIDIIVATVAFGMGINKSNVRFVVHHDLPRSVEAYYQETGRAGRDGMPSEALLLFDEKDSARIRQWISMSDNAARIDVELQKFSAMEAFAEAQTCRRQVLLNYFADYRNEACGNCDICLDPPSHFDGTEDALKVLSCILRVGQSFSAQHVIDVLRGKSLRKLLDLKHDQLSTYGIGREKPDTYWHSIINQLIHQGVLRIDITRGANLKLTEAARPVLKAQTQIKLAVPRLSLKTERGKPDARHYDRHLFAKLKHLRKSIAQQDEVPPFVVFSDATLADMAEKLPTNEQLFLNVSGVGKTKLAKYGDAFIALINDYLQR
ncbi:DNA helicase RecQ [Aestuariibacter salexigens]|uniref:DNA helicase RecQ n=1 Tax=Aestuariibacter salexigens TaxID=226010 RepID=UPI0004124F0D|nr:DNA helicase RecQ [Aestuariibacter salexigens]